MTISLYEFSHEPLADIIIIIIIIIIIKFIIIIIIIIIIKYSTLLPVS